jgi:hypothetical protein
VAVDHTAVHLALRARLLTLEVCTTGTTTLEAVAAGYQRASGSFVTDGFAVGMEVTPTGFTQTTVGVITAVTATLLTISGGRTVEASGAGRSLAVTVPGVRAWPNVRVAPVVGRPYLEEEYVPGTSRVRTFPAASGSLEDTGLYVLRWYAPAETGLQALTQPADAVLALFKGGTALAVAAGLTCRVRTDPAPFRSAVRAAAAGWAVVTITIPWRLDYLNT